MATRTRAKHLNSYSNSYYPSSDEAEIVYEDDDDERFGQVKGSEIQPNPFELTQATIQSFASLPKNSTRNRNTCRKRRKRKDQQIRQVRQQQGQHFIQHHSENEHENSDTNTSTSPSADILRYSPRNNSNDDYSNCNSTDSEDSHSCERSASSNAASVDSGTDNPFALLQQQLLQQEERKNSATDTAPNGETCDPKNLLQQLQRPILATPQAITATCIDTCQVASNIHLDTETASPPASSHQMLPNSTPDDWAICNDDGWDDEDVDVHNREESELEEEKQPKTGEKKRRRDTREGLDFPNTSSHHLEVAKKELEKSRRRARKSVTPARLSTSEWPTRRNTSAESIPRDKKLASVSSSSKPNPSTNSIITTRPNHWGSTTATPFSQRRSSNPFSLSADQSKKNGGRLSSGFSQLGFSVTSRKSQLATATAKRGPLSFNNSKMNTSVSNKMHQSPSIPASTEKAKSFTPAFIKNVDTPLDDDEQMKENADSTSNVQPWFLSPQNLSSQRKKSFNTASKKTAGPLQQRLAKLRAASNADIVRFQSGMYSSIQDPRKDKVYMDVELLSTSSISQFDQNHKVALGETLDNDISTNVWVVFVGKKILTKGQKLRIFNPILLTIAVPKSKVAHVVIGTQFHQVFPDE